ncbi:MAG: glycoside hydrolase family 43 protein, partial [Armatimonadota bacterium]|nr:glycoside hydrolase family 43 protein [Armatimonadota bacterium]
RSCLIGLTLLAPEGGGLWTLEQIHLRDPFILPVPEERRYYLFGTGWHLPGGPGFMAYTSTDLRRWEGPRAAFVAPEGFRSQNYWAPEVFLYRGRYYLLGTFYPQTPGSVRGTWVLTAHHPAGPYRFHSSGPVTPSDWFALDGTLYVDEGARPWLVFCHEWVQVGDGEVCAVRLSDDLSRAEGAPILLFRASTAPWVREVGQPPRRGRVTDGPFLHRAADGSLLMLWSSFGAGGYKLALARSPNGRLAGPWEQAPTPLYEADGGHGMLFRCFDGKLLAVLHQPNGGGKERPRLFAVEERSGAMALKPF